MFKINYNQIVNMEYKMIFEYFDKPLSFISEVTNRNYFFHFLDDSTYFISELHKKDIEFLNDSKDLFVFINYLLDNDELFVLKLDNDSVEYFPTNDYQVLNDFHLETFILNEEYNLDYDYKNKVTINRDTDLFSYLDFPLEDESITIRIVNNENEDSDEFSYNIIEKTLGTINAAFEKIKEQLNNTSAKLLVSAPQRGSFKINFKIPDTTDLFNDDDLSFFPIINIINEINVEHRDPDFDILNKEIYSDLTKQTESLYNAIVDEDVRLNIVSYDAANNSENCNSTLLASLSPSVVAKANLTTFKNKLEEINTLEIVREHLHMDNAELVSASKLRNTGVLKLSNNESIRIKFDADLFSRMKDDEVELNLTTLRSVDILKEYSTNAEQEISNVNYTITNVIY